MKNSVKAKNITRELRKKRNRAKIFGTMEKPRMSVFRSHKYTTVQLINDFEGKTIVSATTKELKSAKVSKSEKAKLLGELIAEKASKVGIKKVIFNKGSYMYHGRIKALADGARSKGLVF